jgi:hypothetical protein
MLAPQALGEATIPLARWVSRTHFAYARLVPTARSLSTRASGAADSQALGGSVHVFQLGIAAYSHLR